MGQRTSLQTLFRDLLGSGNVYFQPPPSLQMQYPAIVYRRDDNRVEHAGNKPYTRRTRYEVILIDQNPDSNIREKIEALPLCSYDRFYTANKLNHDVFKLFF
jgi:hypothetical protein